MNNGGQMNAAKVTVKKGSPGHMMEFKRHAGQNKCNYRKGQKDMLQSLVYSEPEKIFFTVLDSNNRLLVHDFIPFNLLFLRIAFLSDPET